MQEYRMEEQVNHSEEQHQKIWLKCMQMNSRNASEAQNFIQQCKSHINCRITQGGLTLLMVACSISNFAIVEQCIIQEADLSLTDTASGRTALHYCAAVGSVEIFEFLVNRGMNALSHTIGGETPLHKACTFSQESIIEWYLNEKLAAFEVKDNCNHTPFDILRLSDQELYDEVSEAYLSLLEPN